MDRVQFLSSVTTRHFDRVILITDKLLLNLREPKNDNVKYDKNTPKMIINNPEGTGMVKDEEDEHGLQLSHELENFGLNFSR